MDLKTMASIRDRVSVFRDEQAVITPWGDIVTTGKPHEIEKVNRANLLIRNEKFIEEATRIYRQLKKDSKKRKKPWLNRAWLNFCYSWQIQGFWDGDVAELHRWVSSGTELLFKDQSDSRGCVPIESVIVRGKEHIYSQISTRWPDNLYKEMAFIYLKLTPQTKREDLDRIWPVFKEIRAEVWKVSERKKRTFARDLMLFDLHHYHFYGPLTYGQIAQRLKMDKSKVQLACKRISESIRRVAYSTF